MTKLCDRDLYKWMVFNDRTAFVISLLSVTQSFPLF